MPSDAPAPLDSTVAKVNHKESRNDMRPPCSALASMGSTISLMRRARIARADKPSSNPPSSGTNTKRRPVLMPMPSLK